jgi:hypothetical protein
MVVEIGKCKECGETTMLGWYGVCDNCSLKTRRVYTSELNPETMEYEGHVYENGEKVL